MMIMTTKKVFKHLVDVNTGLNIEVDFDNNGNPISINCNANDKNNYVDNNHNANEAYKRAMDIIK